MPNNMSLPLIFMSIGLSLISAIFGWSAGVSNEREHMCRIIAEVSDVRTYFLEGACYQLITGELSEATLQPLRTPESPN